MYRLLFFLLLSNLTYSQTLKGIITSNPKKGIGDETTLTKEAKQPMFYSYVFSDRTSKQELISKEETTIDTIIVHHEEYKELKMETTKSLIKPHKTIHFKDYKSNVYRFESSRKNRYLVTENTSIKDTIPVYKWKLTNDTLSVAGYTCKKATTARVLGRKQNITAWYCDEIPINDGPMDFSGLPGLILQIEIDDLNVIKFEKLKFIKEENTEIKEPENKVEMLTIKQYITKMINGG